MFLTRSLFFVFFMCTLTPRISHLGFVMLQNVKSPFPPTYDRSSYMYENHLTSLNAQLEMVVKTKSRWFDFADNIKWIGYFDISYKRKRTHTHTNNASLELPLANFRQKHHILSIITLPWNLKISARFHKYAYINLTVKYSHMSFEMKIINRSFNVCMKIIELALDFLHLTVFNLNNLFKQAKKKELNFKPSTVWQCFFVSCSSILFHVLSLTNRINRFTSKHNIIIINRRQVLIQVI